MLQSHALVSLFYFIAVYHSLV